MPLVRYDTRESVALVTLNRPKVNALSTELIEDLATALGRAAGTEIRAVVLTGEPHFAAGADIKAFWEAMVGGGSAADIGLRLSEVCSQIESLPKPVIAAVRGFALGGGLELAVACDFRFLADDAQVGQPEIKLGIIPGAGGTQRLPRLIGLAAARDLVYSGRTIGAEEAAEIGLADRVVAVDDLLEAAMGAAADLASGPTRALGIAKRVINRGLGLPIADALAQEADGFAEAFATDDAAEGVAAFIDKRDPRFRGG